MLGFLAVLTAASLTGQPPAADLAAQGRLTSDEIYARLHPELAYDESSDNRAGSSKFDGGGCQESQFVATVGSDTNDKKWSEYNHHWAGLIVLMAGLLALISRHRTMRWARFWPLSFVGLAVFILLRADPENWPLGPRLFGRASPPPMYCNIVSVHSWSRFSQSSNVPCKQASCARVGPPTFFRQCVSPVPQCY